MRKRSVRLACLALALAASWSCSSGDSSSTSEPPETLQTTSTTTDLIATWRTAHSQEMSDALAALAREMAAMKAAAISGDLSAAMSTCSRAKEELKAIQAIPRFPDDQVSAHLTSASNHYYAPMTACLSGVSAESATQIASELPQGDAALGLMNQRLSSLLNR